jgi:hypothetical protein
MCVCVCNNKTGSSLNKSIHQQGKQTGYLSIFKMLQLSFVYSQEYYTQIRNMQQDLLSIIVNTQNRVLLYREK